VKDSSAPRVEEPEKAQAERGLLTKCGMVLFPIACLVVAYAFAGAVSSISLVAHASDQSARRRRWEISYVLVVGLIPVGIMALIWFDALALGLPRRKKMALLGFVGLAVGALAIATLDPGRSLRY